MGYFEEVKKLERAKEEQKAQQERDARSAMFHREDDAYSPQIDPRLGELADAQEGVAQDFRNRLPEIQRQRGVMAGEDVRRNLAQSMAGIRGGYSSRGLLYGGLARNAEAQAQAGAANDMLAQQAQINEQARQQSSQLDSSAYDLRDQQRRLIQARKDALYNKRMGAIEQKFEKDQQRSQAITGLFQGGGQVAGMAAGGASGKQTTNKTTSTKE